MGLGIELLLLYFLYVAIKIGLEFWEIKFILKEMKGEPYLLPPDQYILAAQYSILQHLLEIGRVSITFLIFALWIGGGLTFIDYKIYDGSLESELIILGIFFGINYLFLLPLGILEKIVDWRFGFWKGDWKLFLIDELKKIALFLVIGTPLAAGIIYFVENFENWWLYSFLLIFGGVLLINLLFPYLASWFNRFEPVEDPELVGEIEKILERYGFSNGGVYRMDASKRDTRLNGFLFGLGKSKRIVLYDTLIEKLTKEEILAVLGHELGHFRHQDIWFRLGAIGVILFATFYLFGHIPEEFYLQLQIFETGSTLIILITLFLEPLLFLLQPLLNWVSRRAEFRADQTGAEVGGAHHLASALRKLVQENRSFPKVSPIYGILHYTHPPIGERLQRLEKGE
jgi:STE24 endopeptidase